MRRGGCGTQVRAALTWYFPLAPRRVPSLSQVTMGLGFPKAVQVMVILPPSLASMYWGGVSVKVGGAAKNTSKVRDGLHPPAQNSAVWQGQRNKNRVQKLLPDVIYHRGEAARTSRLCEVILPRALKV